MKFSVNENRKKNKGSGKAIKTTCPNYSPGADATLSLID